MEKRRERSKEVHRIHGGLVGEERGKREKKERSLNLKLKGWAVLPRVIFLHL